MFGFGKKVEIKNIEINEGYHQYLKNPDKITILCVDEVRDYDNTHILGSECLPLRIIDKYMEEYYPDKDLTYYVYAINPAISERAYKKLDKLGYHVYNMGSYSKFHEDEEGLYVKKKARRR